jgi:hypothetical protein
MTASGSQGPSGREKELEDKVAFLRQRLAEKKAGIGARLADQAQDFMNLTKARGSASTVTAWENEAAQPGITTGSGELFRQTAGGVSRLRAPTEVGRDSPGVLYELGLEEVSKFIGNRMGDGMSSAFEAPSIVTYLQAIFHGHLPQGQLGHRATRELSTIGHCLDALAKGDLPHLGDLLMQRFKKLEVEALEGHERAGETLELLPLRAVGLASQQELEAAQAEEIRQGKLVQARRGRGNDAV